MLSTFLITGDSSELAAGDELTASNELVFASWASASATFSLRVDDDTGFEDPEYGVRRTRRRSSVTDDDVGCEFP
jgi:hypothetical protein